MLSVTCNCCGAVATNPGDTNGAPFGTWNVVVATSDTPLTMQPDPASGVPISQRAQRKVPGSVVQLCISCRTDLVTGNFTNMATKAKVANTRPGEETNAGGSTPLPVTPVLPAPANTPVEETPQVDEPTVS